MTVWYQRAEGALHRRVGGEGVLAAADHDRFEVLSETAEQVWRRLEDPRTGAELVDELAADYGEPPEQIASQVETLLGELARLGWVEVVGDGDD